MKSKRFALPPQEVIKGGQAFIHIPIINAYSIEYWDIHYNGVSQPEDWVSIAPSQIGIFLRASDEFDISPDETLTLTIHYHGIRDYQALFPSVQPSLLAIRLARFYEDAERCFDNQAWMPFLLMCGGIFEGLLQSKGFTDYKFGKKVERASSAGLLTPEETDLINKVRSGRNLIHANEYNTPYPERKYAMDVMKVLGDLIEKFAKTH